MIDVSNEIFTELTNALTSYDNHIGTSSVYVNIPSSYPFVSIEEKENTPYQRGEDWENIENFADVHYEINIYSKDPLKKTNAEKIFKVVDNYFNNIGFVRITKTPLQDANETIYRIVVRYNAIVSKNKDVYRR